MIDRFIRHMILGFATFTLAQNLVYVLQGSLFMVILMWVVLTAVAGYGQEWLWRRQRGVAGPFPRWQRAEDSSGVVVEGEAPPDHLADSSDSSNDFSRSTSPDLAENGDPALDDGDISWVDYARRAVLVGLGGIFVALSFWLVLELWGDPFQFWLLMVGYFGFFLLFFIGEGFNDEKRKHTTDVRSVDDLFPTLRASVPTIFFLTILCAVAVLFTLSVRLTDNDDAAYLSRAAFVADAPFDPLPRHLTMYPPEYNAPFAYITFPLIAFNDFVGMLTLLTNSEPPVVSAFIIAPLAAFAVMLAYAALFRALAPRNWMWMLVILLLVLIFEGPHFHFFSNYSFIRIWQGKAILQHVWLPLALLFGLRYGAKGDLRDLVTLFAIQIGTIGLSSVAFWMSPTAVFIGVFAGFLLAPSMEWRDVNRRLLLGGFGTAFYPLLVGAAALMLTDGSLQAVVRIVNAQQDYRNLFGLQNQTFWFWQFMLLSSILLAPSRAARILIATATLVVWLFFASPTFQVVIATRLTSTVVYWRIWWLVPLPLIAAVVLSAPIRLTRWLVSYLAVPGLTYAAPVLALVLGFGIYRTTLTPTPTFAGMAELVGPSVKIAPPIYRTARALHEILPPGSQMIGPEWVNAHVLTFRGKIYPIAPRENTIEAVFLFRQGLPEYHAMLLYSLRYAKGEGGFSAENFDYLFEHPNHPNLNAVVLGNFVGNPVMLADYLTNRGFVRIDSITDYQVWVRAEFAPLQDTTVTDDAS